MKATLGGAFLRPKPRAKDFKRTYEHIGYVWIDLDDGTRMQLFYNDETRLFCADIVNKAETRGNEFVRTTVPRVR